MIGIPKRLAAIAMGVVLLAIAALTVLAFRAAAKQRAAHEALVTGIAGWVGQRYATSVSNEIYLASNAVFSRAGLGRGSPRSDAPPLGAIVRAAHSVAACQCAPVLTPVYAFLLDRARGSYEIEWVTSGATTTAAASHADLERDLRELLQERGWDFALLPALDPGGRLLFIAKHQAIATLFYGIAVDSAVVVDQIFRPCLERRAELTEGLARFSLSPRSIFLEAALGGSTVIASGGSNVRPSNTVGLSLSPVFGTIQLTAGILEPDARLIAGPSMAGSPVVLAVVLATLGAVALLGFWWSARRALELAATRAALVSSVNHELRTPLTQILLYGELIQRGQPPGTDGPEGAAQVIVRESRRLLRLVGNALHLAADGVRMPVRRERVPLAGLLEAARDDYRLLAAERGVAPALAVEGEPAVMGDPDGIRQMVINLLDNAVRHGPEGQAVVVGAVRQGDTVELFVQDQGPGIPVAWRARVWEPFVQVPKALGTGSGMGLAVVRRLATRYGGTVGIREAMGGGAVVFVRMPAADG
ncbi:MAG: HAMP domain-containing histidine kinase [Gemmatimonadales bacterium]|nr:HAMP domain-containing histidine kinase [Gemmatimonadales bacterium]